MYNLDILIPFDLVVDLDIGLLKLVRFEYSNNDYFYKGILQGMDDCLRYSLMTREDPNPLSIAAVNPDDHETLDEFYKQFMEREYTKIMNLSQDTAISDLTKVSGMTSASDRIVRITIMCRSEEEKKLINLRKMNPFRVIVSNPEKIDLSQYKALFVRNVYDLDMYRNVEALNLYIANYGFNLVKDPSHSNAPGLPIDVVAKYSKDNEINIFTVYNLDPDKIPKG